ncbi:MAG: hypothetical protein HKO59_04135 [Phycisphaerales bacterium]|nr:hypothetical protein [Phycisphaerae bacterium]NNF44904.1 hypothetical protein [Phycisphaerales bacterium]NNM25167.1 hypothetical protein [Phycisphaerales bacterium]
MNTIGNGGNLNGLSFLKAQNAQQKNAAGVAKSLEKLATGSRINRGADDPAGLITSENLRAVLSALDAETRTLERADLVAATADGALTEVSDLLNQAESLVVANANGAGLSDEERQANQMEIDSIVGTINRISGTTSFNGDTLLDGTASLSAAGQTIDLDSVSLAPIGEGADAQAALSAARDKVTTLRGKLGSFSKDTVGANLRRIGVEMENIAAAESKIRDTDYGQETANLARTQVLQRAGIMAMGLVTQSQSNVLDLLG